MKSQMRLWAILLAAPAIWFTSLCTNFVLAPWACALHWKPALYCVSIVALAATALCGLTAWKDWNQLGRADPGEASGAVPSERALASGGVLLSAMFFLVILAQGIAEVTLGACQ
jgi:hypothetical protein